jgi:hypothetical protein
MNYVASTILLLLMATETGRAAEPTDRFGVATSHNGAVCLSIRGDLPAHSRIALVTPAMPQGIARATVAEPGPGCAGAKGGTTSRYSLHVTQGGVPDNTVLIGVLDGAGLKLRNGTVILPGSGKWPPETFRSCTTVDGVHLTVWRGEPLHSIRIWHAYYYVGQDLVPTCTDKDTAP